MERASEQEMEHTQHLQRRVVLDGVLHAGEAQHLAWLLHALAHAGYRPGVESVTVWEIACCDPRLLPPLAAARQAVLQAVEGALGREAELLVEWSGLVSWGLGSGIGWHIDNGREYLRQRVVSAVLYLNEAGVAFGGGALLFRSGSPRSVAPRVGRLVAFGSGAADEHAVEAVSGGERMTFTVWFTEDPSHSEDHKILALLAASPGRGLGMPSSLWASRAPDEEAAEYEPGSSGSNTCAGGRCTAAAGTVSGACVADVRAARLQQLGLDIELPIGLDGPVTLRWPATVADPGSGRGGDGRPCAGGKAANSYACTDLQQASLLAHYCAAMARSGFEDPAGCSTSCPSNAEPRCCSAGRGAELPVCWSYSALRQAEQELDHLLDDGAAELRRLLPAWRAHGFLVCGDAAG